MKLQLPATGFLDLVQRLRRRSKSLALACAASAPRVAAQVVVTVGAATLLVIGALHAAGSPGGQQVAANPGPAGDFTWKGFNWKKRDWNGPPQYNERFDANNVGDPDAKGFISLKITNSSGKSPTAAEFRSTRRGFGYGTYTVTVEKNINQLQKEVVWGCMYTYDPDVIPGYTEIDLCEASAWGGGGTYGVSWPVTQGHGYWLDATKPNGEGNRKVDFEVFDSLILTHKMVWEPGKLTFETYAGETSSHRLVRRTVLDGPTVPQPSKEAVHFNLWVIDGGGGNPDTVKPETVVVRDFSFIPSSR